MSKLKIDFKERVISNVQMQIIPYIERIECLHEKNEEIFSFTAVVHTKLGLYISDPRQNIWIMEALSFEGIQDIPDDILNKAAAEIINNYRLEGYKLEPENLRLG